MQASHAWIINRRQDLFWFSGSALFGYGLLALAFVAGGVPGKLVAALAFALDGPHVYSTATRAVFDPLERRRLGWVWLALLPLCLIGPLLTLQFGFSVFFLGIAALSSYHISKQHMGFVMIYKRKAREREDFKIDRYFTIISLMLPFAFYFSSVVIGGPRLLLAFLIPAVLIAGWYTRHQIRKRQKNTPKLLLMAGFMPLTWLAWGYAAIQPYSPVRLLAAAVIINIGHSFQYLKLMWFHNYNRYSEAPGILGLISRRWLYFIGAAVLLALPNHLAGYASNDILSSFMLGFLLFHFVLDARLWRVRGNAELANALQL